MNVNLELLCMQAAQRLAHQHQIDVELPSYRSFYGLEPTEFMKQLKFCAAFVQELIDTTPITYQDLYAASDIGRERLLLVGKLNISPNFIVLDVGCGRGYTTFAAALQGAQVIGIDLMNGGGRWDWWQNWISTANELQLSQLIFGIRGDITTPPIQSNTGILCLSAHAIRNLHSLTTFTDAFRQMGRITGPQGRIYIAESLPVAKTKAQEAHLQLYNLRVKHKQGDLALLPEDELKTLVENAGLSIIESTIHDFRLAATPPIFWLDPPKTPKYNRKRALDEFYEAIAAVHKHGETSTPLLLLTAIPKEN